MLGTSVFYYFHNSRRVKTIFLCLHQISGYPFFFQNFNESQIGLFSMQLEGILIYWQCYCEDFKVNLISHDSIQERYWQKFDTMTAFR